MARNAWPKTVSTAIATATRVAPAKNIRRKHDAVVEPRQPVPHGDVWQRPSDEVGDLHAAAELDGPSQPTWTSMFS